MTNRSGKQMGLLLLALVAVLPACASTGGSAVYRQEVGAGTESNAREIVERIMGFHQYELDRIEEPPNFMIESRWLLREPFADERLGGVTEAESRMVVMGRTRAPSELGDQFAFTFVLENRTRGGEGAAWVETQNSEMFVAYAKRIGDQLEQEFRTVGVRRF